MFTMSPCFTSLSISGVPLNVETFTRPIRPAARIAAATNGTSALS
jgi:hypothetical protein